MHGMRDASILGSGTGAPRSATGPSRAGSTAALAEAGSTGFGATIFELAGDAPQRGATTPSAFDVCHAGLALRAVLFVHGALAIGLVFVALDATAWLALFAAASAIALPATLLWLVALCGVKKPLGAARPAMQWLAATVLGALAAFAAAQVVTALLPDPGAAGLGVIGGIAPPLAGAAFAAAIFHWLTLRAEARLPAETMARLAELQSRIRPHFLFNTLNTALALVRLDPARAESVLEDLAELFRVAISDGQDAVTLGEEVELAERYLAIEQLRFGDRMDVHWELSPEAASARVPRLILQPLVENAVRHGIEPSAEGGVIRIRTKVKLGRAVLSVANSVPKEASKPGHGMALRNVRERLALLHDVAAQFDSRREGDVYRTQIVVPL
jgi:two-component system sensor histidine kinase AlgZ